MAAVSKLEEAYNAAATAVKKALMDATPEDRNAVAGRRDPKTPTGTPLWDAMQAKLKAGVALQKEREDARRAAKANRRKAAPAAA